MGSTVSVKPLDFGLRYGLVVELVGVLLGTLICWFAAIPAVHPKSRADE
jgi:hypothetical protein